MWATIRDIAKKALNGNPEDHEKALETIKNVATAKSGQNTGRQRKFKNKNKGKS